MITLHLRAVDARIIAKLLGVMADSIEGTEDKVYLRRLAYSITQALRNAK